MIDDSLAYQSLLCRRDAGTMHITLNRPHARNAFDAGLIRELHDVATRLATETEIRVVVLRGAGAHFCAGADLTWMQASLDLSLDENRRDAQAMAEMFAALNALPQALIGCVHGAALGGGTGLVAVCDRVLTTSDAIFGLTEVRLGLLPAVIAPYVIAKIGVSHTRSFGVSGNKFDAQTALALGLVHHVVAAAELDDVLAKEIAALYLCAPGAIAEFKALLCRLQHSDDPELTVEAIVRRRQTPEAQAGLRAFLERSSAPWSIS